MLPLLIPHHALADSVRTSADNGFARLHFTLAPLAHAKAALAGGVLTIAFDRKVDITPAGIEQGLGSYIANAREDADGQTFRLALTQNVRLHTSVSGDTIAVDLAPESFSGLPPDLPPPPPKEPSAVDVASLPALNIRVGAYSSFSRLVFDWPRKVAYAVFPGAGYLTIRFESQARPDLSALASVAPPWVKESGWRIEGRGTVIEFGTDASSGFHDFRDGARIVLDILAPKADASAYKPPTESGKPATQIKVTKLAANATGVAQTKAILDTANALRGADESQRHPTLNPQRPPAKPGADVLNAGSTGNATPSTKPADVAGRADGGGQSGFGAVDAARGHIARRGAGAAYAERGFALDFPGAAARPAAVFIRGSTAWIVLDGASTIDSRQLPTHHGDVPRAATRGGGATVRRIGVKLPEQIAVRAEGSDLKVVLAPDVA